MPDLTLNMYMIGFFSDANKVCPCNPVSSHGYRKDFGGYGLPSHKIFYQVWSRWKPYRASYCISARLYSYSWYGNDGARQMHLCSLFSFDVFISVFVWLSYVQFAEDVEKVCMSLGFPFQCFSSQDAKALKEGFLRNAANEIREKVSFSLLWLLFVCYRTIICSLMVECSCFLVS